MLNQFKIGLRKEIMKDVGVLLLREEELSLEKAEELAKYQETAVKMMQGKAIQALQVTCYTCGKVGHVSRDCRGNQNKKKVETRLEGRRDRQPGSQRRNECFLCQGLDHWARDCPNRGSTERRPSNGYDNSRRGKTEDWSSANVVMERRDVRSDTPQNRRNNSSFYPQGSRWNSRSWTGGATHQDIGYNRPNEGTLFSNRNREHTERNTVTRPRVSWEEDPSISDVTSQARQPS